MPYSSKLTSTRGLKPYDGMSAALSKRDDRSKVLEKLTEEPSADCIEYGFYISRVWDAPIADYNGDCVKREITYKDLK